MQMKEPTETIRWTVTILLIVAGIISIGLTVRGYNSFFFVIEFVLLATCGALAARYPPYQ